MAAPKMHPLVRDLYKRFCILGQDYPGGWGAVRGRVKEGFRKQAGLTEELDIKRAVNRGRWWTREMVGVIQLKKYRRMRHSYKPFE